MGQGLSKRFLNLFKSLVKIRTLNEFRIIHSYFLCLFFELTFFNSLFNFLQYHLINSFKWFHFFTCLYNVPLLMAIVSSVFSISANLALNWYVQRVSKGVGWVTGGGGGTQKIRSLLDHSFPRYGLLKFCSLSNQWIVMRSYNR